MIICTVCGLEQDESSFNYKNKAKGILHKTCKSCAKIQRNTTRLDENGKVKLKYSYPDKVRSRKKEIRSWFRNIRLGLSCNLCGENHPATLDFHHIDPETKVSEVTTMVALGASKERIQAEMDKCTVLCCNCHRKLHSTGL